MREVSELIYETCKTYLVHTGQIPAAARLFVGAIIAIYFGRLAEHVNPQPGRRAGMPLIKVVVILLFSLIGIAGSYGVAWFGIRVNTFANSRARPLPRCDGKPFPVLRHPAQGGHEHRHGCSSASSC